MTISPSHYKKWFMDAPDGVYVYSGDGTILAANTVAYEQLGYSHEEILRLNLKDIDAAAIVSGLFGVGKSNKDNNWPFFCRRLLVRKDGYSEPVEVKINPVNTEQDTFIAIVRNLNQEISLERQLQQALKMEAIGTLAGGIAHDFNNILAVILGYGQIVKDQLPKESSTIKDVDQIINAGIRAADLIKQILTFSRQGQEELKPLRIQYLIKEIFRFLRASLPATIELEQKINSDCGVVMADPSKIHQVLMNLCTNAKHAIGDKSGLIHIGLDDREIDNPEALLAHPLISPGRYVVLTVRDNGHGMDEETMARIFDPFYTTKGKDMGTGLGLAIVYGIIRNLKGDITVESRVGEGTEFNVYIPVEKGEYENVGQLDKEIVTRGDEKILVVDDEATICITLRRMLEKEGYDVTTCSSSLEAVTIFRQRRDSFDLVITDLTMPEMTGIELAKEIVAVKRDMSIILMSGYDHHVNKKRATDVGIKEYLTKPFTHRELAVLVRKVLDNA